MKKSDTYFDVVIIDSGASDIREKKGISFAFQGSNVIHSDCFEDTIGHGTSIESIIRLHNPNVNCFFIRIIENSDGIIDEKLVIYALEYIIENITCRIINMSFGVAILKNRPLLYSICQKLKEKGIILISAFDNLQVISFPAGFDNVIGVASLPDCKKITDIVFLDNSIANVCAKGGIQRVKWLGSQYIFAQGNSFACAHITGMLSKSECKSAEEALLYLRKKAKRIVHNTIAKSISYPNIPKGIRTAIFPFNKETHSLLRFQHLVLYDIVSVYDVRQSQKIHASTNTLLNISSAKDYIIQSIDSIQWDSFDLLIIGHTNELINQLNGNDWFIELVLEANKREKYIYCFDDISDLIVKFSLSPERVFCPKTTVDNIESIPLGMLYRPWVPMLGVFGTTSKQGKFSLQLILREKIIKKGYRIGQIGTEPSAYLFGMDLCFHFGYHSSSNVVRHNMVRFLNYEIEKISRKGVDIILAGCQSGTIPYDFGNIDYYSFSQNEFLMAVLPDAVILCVNSFDSLEYINRTIQFIESYADCSVIALVIFPMGYHEKVGRSRLVSLSDEELKSVKEKYTETFCKPAYILGNDTDMDVLLSDVISFFLPKSENRDK